MSELVPISDTREAASIVAICFFIYGVLVLTYLLRSRQPRNMGDE